MAVTVSDRTTALPQMATQAAVYGRTPNIGLLNLPLELRECIYEHYLVNLMPATFAIVKYPQKAHWIVRSTSTSQTPSLLLVCRTISAEFQKYMLSQMKSGAACNQIPLSQGPTIRIEPRWSPVRCGNSHAEARTIERANVQEVLTSVFLSAAPSMRLQLVMPQFPEDAEPFNNLLRFIGAISRARSIPLKNVRAIRDPITGPGWTADINAVADEVAAIRCESMIWENWYRPWFRSSPSAEKYTYDPAIGVREPWSMEDAWAVVLESCRMR